MSENKKKRIYIKEIKRVSPTEPLLEFKLAPPKEPTRKVNPRPEEKEG